MSFLIADPEAVSATAGDLAEIRSTLGAACAAAAAPTTGMAAAAADEVSAAIAQVFGAYGQEFQALNAQAAAFHAEFVSLLNNGAAAYLSAEITNAEQNLLIAVNAPAQMLGQSLSGGAAATDPIGGLLGPILGGGSGGLGGILGGSGGLLDPILFGGTGGLLGPLIGGNGVLTSLVANSPLGPFLNGAGQQFGAAVSALINGNGSAFLSSQLQGLGSVLLPGFFPPTGGALSAPAPGGAWAQLFANTTANLAALNGAFAADPFPLLRQIIANQQGYAYLTGRDLTIAIQNLPTEAAHLPETIQAEAQSLATFNPGFYAQTFANGTIGSFQTLNTSFAAFGHDLQANLAGFPADWALVNRALAAGNYHLAVTDGTTALLNVFMSGFDTHNLSAIKLLGPVGDLFPVLTLPGQQLQGLSTLMIPHSIPGQMTNNLGNFLSALADTSISTTISGTLIPPALVLGANFGLPLSLLFGVAGAPVATFDGVATAGTVIGGGIATGNPIQVVGGLIDAPAYVLNGFLNGETIIDVPLPVTFNLPLVVSVVSSSGV